MAFLRDSIVLRISLRAMTQTSDDRVRYLDDPSRDLLANKFAAVETRHTTSTTCSAGSQMHALNHKPHAP